MPHLSSIWVYPFKSFDGLSLREARIVENGGLEHDRQFALFDAAGKYINAKRTPRVHGLQVIFDPAEQWVRVKNRLTDCEACFALPLEQERLEACLSDYFDEAVTVRSNTAGGFPDDSKSPGPTIIGRSTLESVASWYPGVTADESRRRFRANLELSAPEPFWEDRLYGAADTVVQFRIGTVLFEGTNPCQRCVVPTRDTDSGEATADFAAEFMERRKATLPPWADQTRFNHYYRLAVNTRVPESEVGKILRVGDEVTLAK